MNQPGNDELCERLAHVTVGEIMTESPLTIGEGAHLSDVLELMENERIKHLPVVENGKLTGLITDRQLRDALPSVLTLKDPAMRRKSLAATRLGQVCARNPRSIDSGALVLAAIDAMRKIRAGSLPVVDEGRLVGIVTSGDLITLLERILRNAR